MTENQGIKPVFDYTSCNCICKDHRNEIEAPDPVGKDLISYKIMKRFDKKARLIINGTETTIFVKYPIFRKEQPFFFGVLSALPLLISLAFLSNRLITRFITIILERLKAEPDILSTKHNIIPP